MSTDRYVLFKMAEPNVIPMSIVAVRYRVVPEDLAAKVFTLMNWAGREVILQKSAGATTVSLAHNVSL